MAFSGYTFIREIHVLLLKLYCNSFDSKRFLKEKFFAFLFIAALLKIGYEIYSVCYQSGTELILVVFYLHHPTHGTESCRVLIGRLLLWSIILGNFNLGSVPPTTTDKLLNTRKYWCSFYDNINWWRTATASIAIEWLNAQEISRIRDEVYGKNIII